MRTPIQLVKAVYERLYYYCAPDKIYLNKKFKQVFRRNINWTNPTTYNEKLQWLKIYDRNPLYTKLVDKYEVRQYVAEKIGEEYLIPCLGVWDKYEDIDFSQLPNEFVLKCTHDSGSVVICKDKESFDFDEARKKISNGLKRNFYYNAREWPYKNVKPRIIAEQYMEDLSTSQLKDYKFFVFDGEVKALFIASDRGKQNEEVKFDFYDEKFNWMDMRHGHPNSVEKSDKPGCFEEMKSLAVKLASDFPQARVDFYACNGKILFGEITFFHHSGFVPFEPAIWDDTFGAWIELPSRRK